MSPTTLPIPLEPEPTPKATKPIAKARASSTNIHLAWRRRREKKSWSSQLGAFCFRFGCVCARLRCVWAAPLAMFLGYLAFGGVDRIPIEGLADLVQTRPGRLVAERSLQARREEVLGIEPERDRGIAV